MNLSEEVLGAFSYEVSIKNRLSLRKASELVQDLSIGVSFQNESIDSIREALGVSGGPAEGGAEPLRVPGTIFQPRTKATAAPFIQASGLVLEYGSRAILKDPSFTLLSAERYAFPPCSPATSTL